MGVLPEPFRNRLAAIFRVERSPDALDAFAEGFLAMIERPDK